MKARQSFFAVNIESSTTLAVIYRGRACLNAVVLPSQFIIDVFSCKPQTDAQSTKWKGTQVSTVRFEETIKIAAPVERVWGLIEAPERAPEWNPLLKHVIPQKKNGRGVGGTSAFEARFSAMTITGTHHITTWAVNRQIGAGCVAASSFLNSPFRLATNGHFHLQSVSEEETILTAILSVDIPTLLVPLVNSRPVKRFFTSQLATSLSNIARISKCR